LNLLSLDELPPLHELQATLDMSQAGAVLHAGADTLALPGVASGEAVEDATQSNDASDTNNIENAKEADTNDANTANQNATEESAGHPHEHHSQEQEPGASS
jgi:hypothetical protein